MSSLYDFDLSGNRIKNWEFFPETVAAFSVPQTLDGYLSMLVWGVILIDPHREPDFALRFLSSGNGLWQQSLYLSGWGHLKMEGVRGGEIRVWPYEPTLQFERLLLPAENGTTKSPLTYSWPIAPGINGTDYRFRMVLEQPLGCMVLQVNAMGSVKLTVDPGNFVPVEEVAKAPAVYCHDWTRRRQRSKLIPSEALLGTET